MGDDRTFDRRSFLRRTSTAGLVGLSGIKSLGLPARRDGDGRNDGNQGEDDEQNGPIDYFQAVLPAGFILDADLVYRIVIVGGPTQPGERPPPLCFPEGEKQWRARDALVVKPTEDTGVFGDDDIGALNRTRVYLEEPVEPGSVWRIAGGQYCNDHALVTIHELPPQLSEYFSTRLLDIAEEFEQNETAENVTVGDEVIGNETVGTGTPETETGENTDS